MDKKNRLQRRWNITGNTIVTEEFMRTGSMTEWKKF